MASLVHSTPLRTWLMLTPTLLVIGLLFVGGIVVGLGQSLAYMPMIGLHQFTVRHYGTLLTDLDFYRSLVLTLYLAGVSTLLSATLAVATAFVLRRHLIGRQFVTFLWQVPLPVPHLVAATGIVLLLTQSGLFARLLVALGWLEEPQQFPVLVFDRWQIGTLLVYLWKEIPFIGVVVLAVLKGIGQEYEEVAQTLGATPWQRFRYVLLPLLLPGLITTSLIVFAFVFGSFEIPLLLGQRYPNVLPVMAYRAYSSPDLQQRPVALAMGMVITLLVMGLLTLARGLSRRWREAA
ncbi:MAG: sugar ABC transporter permease [Caldilineaceae bacterium]|nr:sugar ABC transporter permease [Caldilineaceae bacterium]